MTQIFFPKKINFRVAIVALALIGVLGSWALPGVAHPRGRSAEAPGILANVLDSSQATFHQFAAGGMAAIPEGATIQAGTLTLGVSFSSDVITPVRLQAEVRPMSAAFTGVPTATGGVLVLTKQGTVTIRGLADGSYHWRARLMNAITGSTSDWQEFGVTGNVDFTVALREPVVIIPGISGTALDKATDGSEVWPNVDKMLVSPSDDYLDALALDANGADAQSTIRVGAILSSAKLTLGGAILFSDDFYGNLITAFTNEGYVTNQNLFTAPYDWRADIGKSAQVLAAKIAQAVAASPTGKINIVAHSMGGLVLKKYLASLSGTRAAFLDKVVLIGVPELGAPYAFKILNYGDDLGIPIVNQAEVKKITQNMPAIYELLPSRKYVGVAGGYVQDFRAGADDATLDYAAAANFATGNPGDTRNAALTNLADNFHQAIDGAPVVAPNVSTIVGCGKPTITGFDVYDGGGVDLERGSGDGTVPEVSAMYLANGSTSFATGVAHDYFVLSGETGIDHTGLVSDPRPVALIKNIIDGTMNSVPLPSGISANVADCATQGQPSPSSGLDTTIEFSVTGSADLGVYDAEGNFTGLTASGTVALGIPGSEYDQLASSTFVLVPAPSDARDAYRAVTDAVATGTFAMKVRGYRGDAVDHAATYLSMPAPDTSTVAELDFMGFSGNMDLHLRRRSHPNSESVRHADSVMSAPDPLKDRTPPIITVASLPRDVLQNATATISWSAADAGSGVATTMSTLNGMPVANGATVLFSDVGKNILKIEATDNAGNLREKEIDVDVNSP